jgi:hypothetical protein
MKNSDLLFFPRCGSDVRSRVASRVAPWRAPTIVTITSEVGPLVGIYSQSTTTAAANGKRRTIRTRGVLSDFPPCVFSRSA